METWIIFVGCLILFTSGLAGHEFIQFEARFGVFVQEMWRNGVSLFPTTYHQAYPDYPVLPVLLMYLTSLLFGKVTLFSCVLPTALASSLTVAMTYRLASYEDRQLAWAAVGVLLITFGFISEARSISLDQYVTLATVCSVFVVYTRQSRAWLILLWAFGFSCRGPLGLIIPWAVVLSFDFIQNGYKSLMAMLCLGFAVLVGMMSVLLGLAYLQGGPSFVMAVLKMQGLGRIRELGHYPFYYYWVHAFGDYAAAFPLAVLAMLSFPNNFISFKKRGGAEAAGGFVPGSYLLSWVLIILLGLSIPLEKKMRYLLPIVPALSIMAAYFVIRTPASAFFASLRIVFLKLCRLSPLIFLILIGLTQFYSIRHHLYLGVSAWPVVITLVVIAGVAQTYLSTESLPSLFVGVAAVLSVYILFASPINVYFNRTKPFVDQVMTLRKHNETIAFYRIGPDAEDIKFLVAYDKPLSPIFLPDVPALVSLDKPSLIIAKTHDFMTLPEQVKSQFLVQSVGRVGHEKMVVLSAYLFQTKSLQPPVLLMKH